MKLHVAQIPKLIARRRASAILGMTIIGMIWAVVLLGHIESIKQDYRTAERTAKNYAMLFEENVLRSIGEIDKAILYLRRSVEVGKSSTDYATIVRTTDVLSEIIVQVAIIDANGISRASNAVPEPTHTIDISDREHFQVHVHSDEDKLFISKPVIGRASGKWSVQFTRRFSNNDGTFAGVVVASMDPAHFTSFYDRINLGSTTSVMLIGNDGVVRSSGGGIAGRRSLGEDLNGTKLLNLVQRGFDTTFEEAGTSPEDSLFFAARKVRGYPLWVTVSTKMSEVYRSSTASLQRYIGIAAILTLMILVALEQILRSEEKAAQKAEHLQLTLEHISQGIMLVTQDRQIPIINRRCGELLKLPDELIETSPQLEQLAESQIQNGELLSAVTEPLDHGTPEYLAGEPAIRDYKRPDGVFIEVRKTKLPDGGFVQTFTDITSRREADAHIARLAAEDPLTKLPNRRVFRSALDELCGRDNRSPQGHEQASAAVLFLDLDRFKVVNDTLGHQVGDLLLTEAAKRLKAVLRSDDIVARLGGDEFAVLLPAIESTAKIEMVANGIIEAIDQPFQIENHLIRSSVSIGIAVWPRDGVTAEELLMAADLALYAVKTERRGSYRFYQKSMNDDVNDRRAIEMDLREALERGELELHYQPVVNLRRNSITGFEALARWHHPLRGMVSPTQFIPVAEDCGLVLALGEWALTEACRTAAQWPDNLKIAVNLSPVQIASPGLFNKVVAILAETGLEPSRLTLEVTERILLENSEKTLSILHKLRQLGIRISLDDFGTGYSSLSYLRSFPFDTIKVDRAFVADLGEDAESNIIVQGVLLIANGLGIRTIAEGVETPFQQEMLKVLGCDEVQGNLLSPSVPVERVLGLIAEWETKKTMAA